MWTFEKTSAFIADYRDNRILWDTKHEDYSGNRLKRELVVHELAQKHGLNPREFKQKVKNLRSCYHRERRVLKRRQSKKAGSNSPWAYYRLMTFLEENDENKLERCHKSDSEAEEMLPKEDGDAALLGISKELPVEHEVETDTIEVPVHVYTNRKPKHNQKNPKTIGNDILGVIKDTLKKDEFATYGDHVANELRNLHTRTQTVVKHLINNILYEAAMGKYDYPVDLDSNEFQNDQKSDSECSYNFERIQSAEEEEPQSKHQIKAIRKLTVSNFKRWDVPKWSVEKTLAFIKDYKENSLLWDVNDKLYKDNYGKKVDVIKELAEKYSITIYQFRRKVKSLRCRFHRELNLMRRGIEKTRPWRYLQPLIFLKDIQPTTQVRKRYPEKFLSDGIADNHTGASSDVLSEADRNVCDTTENTTTKESNNMSVSGNITEAVHVICHGRDVYLVNNERNSSQLLLEN